MVLLINLQLLLLVVIASCAPPMSFGGSSGSSVPLCHDNERQALLALKAGFTISNITRDDLRLCHRPHTKTESWKNGSNCCEWDGVTCDPSSGHVIQLDVSCSLLTGSFPSNSSMLSLPRLHHIDVSYNKLTGVIPPWVFALPSLEYLHLDHNLFTGIAQSQVSNYNASSSILKEFSVGWNQLQGQIPEVVFGLQNLSVLDLQWNSLTGNISLNKLHNLQSLGTLRLSYNNLSIINDMGVESAYSWPIYSELRLASCKLDHFPSFLRRQEKLTALDLSNNNIHGVVPEWFLDTGRTSLPVLDLSHNSLTGGLESLPWVNMEELDISFNMLGGPLPKPSRHTSEFRASNNMFVGDISSLCHMSYVMLDLSHNNLTGSIPDCNAYHRMDILALGSNKLQGEIPSVIFEDCRQLTTLSLSDNLLEGMLPHSLTNCKRLELIDVCMNNLNDTFPHWLGVLPNLKGLIIGTNNFQGPLTLSFNVTNSFSKLRIFDIANNDFYGELPSSLLTSFKAMAEVNSNSPLHLQYMGVTTYQDSITTWVKGVYRELSKVLDNLVLIDASKNRLDGPIPEVFGDLVDIRWLNLAHNNFTGNIPSSFGNLSLLESLDLSFNRLDGHIPSQLVNLNALGFFNVSGNNLVGHVPETKQFSTFSDSSYLGNPGLCGEFLTRKCWPRNEPPSSTPTQDEGSLSLGVNVLEIVVMGFGCGLFVGSVWGYFIFWERYNYWVANLACKIEGFIMLSWRRKRRQNNKN